MRGAAAAAAAQVEQCGWLRKDVLTVPSSMPAIAAMALMVNRGVSGAGVVAELGGPLIGSLSLSDIRVLTSPADLDSITLSVADFLAYQYG